jgi:hypothetical protein
MFRRTGIACCGAILLGLADDPRALAGELVGGRVELGFGGCQAQPFITGGAVCATVGLGASIGLLGPARACFDFRATAGTDVPGSLEAADAGQQSLVTFTGGLEFMNLRSARGPFVAAGIGVGHSTISGAHGPIYPPPYTGNVSNDRTAVAYDVGIGHRFSGGPGPMLLQLALRSHGLLLDATSASAYAVVVVLGVAF